MGNEYDFSQLASIININSYTKNKNGVDTNAKIFGKWMQELGFETVTYPREEIGNHVLFTSAKKEGKKLLLLGHLDTVFPAHSFEKFSEDEAWIYGVELRYTNTDERASKQSYHDRIDSVTKILAAFMKGEF